MKLIILSDANSLLPTALYINLPSGFKRKVVGSPGTPQLTSNSISTYIGKDIGMSFLNSSMFSGPGPT